MSMIATQIVQKSAGAAITPAVSFAKQLRSGESLTGTPTVVEQTTAELTISNVAKNTATLTLEGESVTANQAVQFKVSGGTAGTQYTMLVTCGTDASPAQTLELLVTLEVV